MTQPHTAPLISSSRIILIAGLIQFVNVTDFMMVMPLGPDFAKALGIPLNNIGIIGGAYTLSAAIMGLISALFLDQYARKKALIFCLLGLTLATLVGAVVWDTTSMVVARIVAGAFGGPLTSLSVSLVADWIAPAERGRAMGKVMGGFALASVLGVPFGLELAHFVSWHAPFIATGLFGLAVTALVWRILPYYAPLEAPKPLAQRANELRSMMRSPLALNAYAVMGLITFGGFLIIPNISGHLQKNLHYPREYIALLYLLGGTLSFFGMRFAGKLIDKTSATQTAWLFTGALVMAISTGFIFFPSALPIPVIFALFMVASSGRMVCAQTMSSKIPSPEHRVAFMSIQSAVMHFASATGAYCSSLILVEHDGMLLNVPTIGCMSFACALLVPCLFWYAERRLRHTRVFASALEIPTHGG
ncbi:MAG: MFS transporter [Rickettsiales bacterium]|nr:MFS transporter [Rickettsiales bacterium]